MATPKKRPEDLQKLGRKSTYKPGYCELLVHHMKEGGTLESFGAKTTPYVSTQTVYNWLDQHPDFFDAKKQGEPLRILFYESMAKTMSLGQLRRIKSERARLDASGKVVYDKNGNVVMDREYETATPAQAVFIFLTKNVCGWRDRKDIELSGKDGGPMNFANVSDDDLKVELKKLIAEAKKVV
jgi:hypothetical protein